MSLSQSQAAIKRTAEIAAAILADRDLPLHRSIVPTLLPENAPNGLPFGLQGNSLATLQEAMDALTVEIAVVDEEGKVVLASRSWKLREENSLPVTSRMLRHHKGSLDFLTGCVGDARLIEKALNDVLSGRSSIEKCEFAKDAGKLRGHFLVTITPVNLTGGRAAMIVNEDVSEVHALHAAARSLAHELLHSEDLERRRIAREMHDSTAQDLIAIGLNLKRLAPLATDASSRDALSEIQGILAHTQQDVRTMSYLLHPPLVEEGGLFVALEALTRGLSKRMAIPIDLECSATESRLPIEDESALYRVAQEALMNVHRHASATSVIVRYFREGNSAILTVEDNGVGFGGRSGRQASTGVGIMGMRARLEQLGGTIRLSRLDRGTTLRAILPLRPAD